MEKICIIIPVYNAENYLGKCIDSVLSQSLGDFCLILVNDGSCDGSLEICRRYENMDKRIVVLTQENKGAAAARNAGIDWALKEEKADIIGFIDSDDWVHPDYLLRLYEGIVSSGCKISMCNSFRSSAREHVFSDEEYSFEPCSPEYMWCHDRNLCVVPWGKLFKAELFKTIRFPENARIAEDEFVSYRVLFSCSMICHIKNRLYLYYQGDNSIMRSEWTPNRMIGLEGLEHQLSFFYNEGFREALHESANTYIYMIHHYMDCISKSNKKEYSPYYKILTNKLQNGVNCYFSQYGFPIKGNEWVYALTHPFTGRFLLLIRKINRRGK